MKNEITKRVKELFAAGTIKAFVGLRAQGEHVAPFIFTGPEELRSFVTGDEKSPGGTRYSLAGLLERLSEAYPADTFAVLVRGCDERALQSLYQDGRVATLNPRRIIPIGFSCSTELAERCRCDKPWPDALVVGERTPAAESSKHFESPSVFDGLDQAMKYFQRCLKCHGCRNACPVCGCLECTMEREELVHQRQLPASPSFLLTKAVHMVDRCVYCGLCEEACPARIPLREVYRLVSRMVGYGVLRTGVHAPPLPTPEQESEVNP